ncbi:MAG TPA: hypothetical protein VGX45_08420 [Solirubrobacteraceae bacterium]|jgi:uncharacterized membrane protein YfcA|nr:hypothetical protein [Solirubrobacteraceae bacterium]
MFGTTTTMWKIGLALALGVTILLSAYAHAPRRAVPKGDLRRLVISAVLLYAVGAVASVSHHPILAGLVYAAGIFVCCVALWLSRGTDPEDPPRGGEEPGDERPPPSPDGLPEFEWSEFERAFRAYAERDSAGVS